MVKKRWIGIALLSLLFGLQPCNGVFAEENTVVFVENDFEDVFSDVEETVPMECVGELFDDHESELDECFSSENDNVQYEYEAEIELADASVVPAEEDYGISFFALEEYDGCFGNQLTGLSKEIYDFYFNQYVKNKSYVTNVYTFEKPITFQAKVNNAGSLEQNEAYTKAVAKLQNAIQAASDAFMYDHPELFWFGVGSQRFSISVSGKSKDDLVGTISMVEMKINESYSGALGHISAYETGVKNAMKNIASSSSRYNEVKNIHDYICKNASYSATNKKIEHSSAAFFVGNKAMACEGYAKTFKVLCDKRDIPCVCVSGNAKSSSGAKEAHMWNYVQMNDGKWYLVDTTWDDQEKRIYDTYMLVGWSSNGFYMPISQERTVRTDFSKTGVMNFVYPAMNGNAYKKTSADMETCADGQHEWGSWSVDKKATAVEAGSKSRVCKQCKKTEKATIKKLSATYKVSMDTVLLRVKQSTTKFVVSGLAYGDSVKSYKSSNPAVAVVNKNGKITAKKKGTAQIQVTLASGTVIKVTVKVQTGIVKTTKISVKNKNVSLKTGKAFTIKTQVLPLTSQQKVTYSVANKKIATVSSTGKIVAKKKGKTTVTVKSGNRSVKINVTVK